MSEIIILQDHPAVLKEFMSMPNGIARNIEYYKNINNNTWYQSNLCKKNGCVYFSMNGYTVKRSKESYYLKSSSKAGFSIDEKGKLKVWWGKSFSQIIHLMDDVFNYYNFNWLNKDIYPFITKSIAEKIFSGKITNSLDVIKAYLKVTRINASPALLMKVIENAKKQNGYFSKCDFLRAAKVAKDINHYLEFYYKSSDTEYHEKYTIINDMMKEALILNKKIDYTWSLNRLKEEHKQWTNLIMEEEIKALDDVEINNANKLEKFTPKNFKLLKSEKEVFAEGTNMKHCIYTVYWRNIKEGKYLAYHINDGKEEATLGINVFAKYFEYNQCFSKYNGRPSNQLLKKAQDFVTYLNKQSELLNLFNNIQTTPEWD